MVPTAPHTGTSPRVRFSGKPSGRSWFLASWRRGHSGIGTCWSSWSREASGPRSGWRGSGARTTAGNDGPGTMFHRCCECSGPGRERHVRLTGVAPGGTFGAVPGGVLPGQTSRDGEDHAAAMAGHITLDPLMLHIDCEGTIATINGPKHKALGARGHRAHVWNRLLFSHTRPGQSRSRVIPQRATWRRGELPTCAKGKTTLQTPLPRRGKHTQACFSRRQDSRCVCLPGQASGTLGGREAHVFAKVQGLNDTRAAAPRTRVRPPRARLKRKRGEKEIATPAAGQVSDWLSHIFPSRFSQDSHLDPRTFRGHSSCSWDEFSILGVGRWTVPSSSAPNVERCNWERALPPMQRIPREQHIAAAQIEVGALPEQTLPWLDC